MNLFCVSLAATDGSIFASALAVPGSISGKVENCHMKIFNHGARKGGDV